MHRSLILVGGGLLQVPLVEQAHRMGLRIIIFDKNTSAPAIVLAKQLHPHHIAFPISTLDVQKCRAKALELYQTDASISAALTLGTDASQSVAAICDALSLPGISPESAKKATNKFLMRQAFENAGLQVPQFIKIRSYKELKRAMKNFEFPVVIKPTENMGARGVIRIDETAQLLRAYQHSLEYSNNRELILESYIKGKELSVDSITWHQNQKNYLCITGIADRIISEKNRYFLELGHNLPSQIDAQMKEKITSLMLAGIKALGIKQSAAKADIKIAENGTLYIGEMAARLSGGFMSTHTYPLSSNHNLLEAAICIAMGKEPPHMKRLEKFKKNETHTICIPDKQNENYVAIERNIISEPGKIIAMTGREKMLATKNIKAVFFTANVGEISTQATNNVDKVVHIIALASNIKDAEKSVHESMTHFTIKRDLSYGLDWQRIEHHARIRFGDQICWVCKVCDGEHCASSVPGMGGLGKHMESFRDNNRALSELKIVPNYIHKQIKNPDTSFLAFKKKLTMPIMTAPMTGTTTNMGGCISEYEFASALLQAVHKEKSIAWFGDGASPHKVTDIFQAIKDSSQNTAASRSIMIFKPRADEILLRQRIEKALELGILAIGMDIDAISFKTLVLQKQNSLARDWQAIELLCREIHPLPFILKGILSIEDTKRAIHAGVSAIVVSNHGGRVLSSAPGTARVLAGICECVNNQIPVFVDGGVRSGEDVFKMLALGADAVLVGRTVAIAAIGGGEHAIRHLMREYMQELQRTMQLCGISTLDEIHAKYLLHIKETSSLKQEIKQ